MQRTLITLVVATLLIPVFSFAQSTDLETSIRAALASDPRTSSMSQTQINVMVQALAAQAQSQGMTSQDITWRPVSNAAGPALVAAQCGGFPSYLCTMSAAFGFTGPDYIIALWLGISALLLMFIIGALLEYRHFRHLHPKVTSALP